MNPRTVLRRARGTARLLTRRDEAVALARKVRGERLTYLDAPALVDLWDVVVEADSEGRAGMIVEAGTALGGSSIMLALARRSTRPLVLYDTFGMIPPPSDDDGPEVIDRYEQIVSGSSVGIGGDTYYGYRGDLRDSVRGALHRHQADIDSIDLIQGLYEDTFRPVAEVAVAHIDCDWYDSVMVCLERVWPVLVPGGVVVIDDYDHWDGCRRAVDEFVSTRTDASVVRRVRPHIIKR